jgi:hypothetical protein
MCQARSDYCFARVKQASLASRLRLLVFVPCGSHVRVVGRSRFDGDPGVRLSASTPCQFWAKRIVVVNFPELRIPRST